MKKVLVMFLSCILLSGCVSNSEFRELEQRVSYLEDQLGTYESYDYDSREDEAVENVQDDKSSDSSYSYYIDELSDSEVLEECKYYFYNIPTQGESFEDYYSSLRATPVNTFEDFGVECQFYDNRINNEPTDRDVLTDIRIPGTQAEMDGSIGYNTDHYGVTISMIIKDYDRAANIYDGLYEIIVNDYYYDINDRRDSTSWRTSAMFLKGETLGGFGVDVLSMEKGSNGFKLTATYYVWR